MAALVDDEEDGTIEELEKAVGTKVAFICKWILASPLINYVIYSQNTRLSLS